MRQNNPESEPGRRFGRRTLLGGAIGTAAAAALFNPLTALVQEVEVAGAAAPAPELGGAEDSVRLELEVQGLKVES